MLQNESFKRPYLTNCNLFLCIPSKKYKFRYRQPVIDFDLATTRPLTRVFHCRHQTNITKSLKCLQNHQQNIHLFTLLHIYDLREIKQKDTTQVAYNPCAIL